MRTARPMTTLKVLLLIAFAVVGLAPVPASTAAMDAGFTCPPPVADYFDQSLVGQGRCVGVDGGNATVFSANCTSFDAPSSCGGGCAAEAACVGFELRSLADNTTTCHIVSASAPTLGSNESCTWAQQVGTQSGTGLSVAAASGDPDACCYKRAYPNPNPFDNPVPTPPAQSTRQQAIFANKSAAAAAASQAALPNVTALIDFCANVSLSDGSHLFDVANCPAMAAVTANGTLAPWPSGAQIAERFALEIRAAEYGHGYHTLTSNPSLKNVFNPSYEFLLNLWEPSLLDVPMAARQGLNDHGNLSKHPHEVWDAVQQQIFGCDPFTGHKGMPANFTEAANRIVYTALNFHRNPLGNTPNFGTFSAVMRPSFVADKIMFTPTDSAKYHDQIPHCTLWPGCVPGTIADHYHILLSWMALAGNVFPPQHKASLCSDQMDMIHSMVCPRPPPTVNPSPPASAAQCGAEGKYWEADILGTARYPESVKFIAASFTDYFGNNVGMQLRDFCARHNWALLWVLYADDKNKNCLDPRRLIDPVVIANTTANATLAVNFTADVQAQWQVANASWTAHKANPKSVQQWKVLTNSTTTPGSDQALIWNFGSQDCQDFDNCLGVTHADGTCVCYSASQQHNRE